MPAPVPAPVRAQCMPSSRPAAMVVPGGRRSGGSGRRIRAAGASAVMATTPGTVMAASRRVRTGQGPSVSSVRSRTPVRRSRTRRSPAGAGCTARPVHTGPGSRCWPGPVPSYTPAARTIGWAPGTASSTDPRVATPPAPSVNSDSVTRRRAGPAPVSHKIHAGSSSTAGTRWRACRRTCSSSSASSPPDPPPACTTPVGTPSGSGPTDTAIARAASGTSSSASGPGFPPGAPNWLPTTSSNPGPTPRRASTARMPRITSAPLSPRASRHPPGNPAGTLPSWLITVISTPKARNAATRRPAAATSRRRYGAVAPQVKARAAKVRPVRTPPAVTTLGGGPASGVNRGPEAGVMSGCPIGPPRASHMVFGTVMPCPRGHDDRSVTGTSPLVTPRILVTPSPRRRR